MDKTFLIFGASITCGFWDKEGGWVARLRKLIDEKNLSGIANLEFFCPVYNLGISGDSSDDLLARFTFETKHRIDETEKSSFIFSIGTNDSRFVPSKNDNGTGPEKFGENIKKLIDLAKKYSQEIVFVGLLPVEELKTTPIFWNEDSVFKNEYIKKYNNIIRGICAEKGVYFIDIFDEWTGSDYKKLLEDGLHPNSEGHEKIFQSVRDFLVAKKII